MTAVFFPSPGNAPGSLRIPTAQAFSLALFFHMADVDEHYFTRSNLLREVDTLISCGLTDKVYFEDFNPKAYRWKTYYNPREIIGVFYAGLLRVRARTFMAPVFGDGDVVVERIKATNPTDLVFSTDRKSAELAICANYPGRDSFNFDAQAESFQWPVAQKGIELAVVRDRERTHSQAYFRANIQPAMVWLGRPLLGPADGLPKKMGSSAQQQH